MDTCTNIDASVIILVMVTVYIKSNRNNRTTLVMSFYYMHILYICMHNVANTNKGRKFSKK